MATAWQDRLLGPSADVDGRSRACHDSPRPTPYRSESAMSRLQGRRTVITGAASGIGEQTARLFVAEGATVVLADVDDERGSVIADGLGGTGPLRARRRLAGGGHRAGRRGVDDDVRGTGLCLQQRRQPGVDRSGRGHRHGDVRPDGRDPFRGVFLGIRAAARVMRPQGYGSIINTASVAGITAERRRSRLSACKAAIAHLTRTDRQRLGEDGVGSTPSVPAASPPRSSAGEPDWTAMRPRPRSASWRPCWRTSHP